MTKQRSLKTKVRVVRKDGRKPLLVYLRPDLIKQLKRVALDQDTTAYEITEQAVQKWLSAHKTKRAASR
jgi:hypothetical protein